MGGNLKAKVSIQESQISTRIIEGIHSLWGTMKLEGKLLEPYRNLIKIQSEDIKHTVIVEIDFYEEYMGFTEGLKGVGKKEDYIGMIQLFEKDITGNTLRVPIELPIRMFTQLSSMKGESIWFETEDDIIEKPTQRQKEAGHLAFILAVYFRTDSKLSK